MLSYLFYVNAGRQVKPFGVAIHYNKRTESEAETSAWG